MKKEMKRERKNDRAPIYYFQMPAMIGVGPD